MPQLAALMGTAAYLAGVSGTPHPQAFLHHKLGYPFSEQWKHVPVALREPHRSGATQNGSHCSPRPFYERRLDHESILSRSGRAMAHDEEQDGHSVVKQKPVDSDLKNTH